MVPLDQIFAPLHHMQFHRSHDPPLPVTHGKTSIVASNGIWLRGHNGHLTVVVAVQRVQLAVPGLLPLAPCVSWRVLGNLPDGQPRRLPARPLLYDMLAHARHVAIRTGGPDRQIEQQYHIVRRGRWLLPIIPVQQAGAGTVSYQMPKVPSGDILLDLHSHGNLAAFFSATDTQDDSGLSVSAVIGTIFEMPTICCRLNVYGRHHEVPCTLVFDSPGPFHDGYRPAL